MKKQPIKRINMNLFFLEAILVVFLLSLSSTVIIKGFFKADQIRKSSQNKIYAMMEMTNIAEELKAGNDLILKDFPKYYDSHWRPVQRASEAEFIMTGEKNLSEQKAGILEDVTLRVVPIHAFDQDGWELTVTNYIPHISILTSSEGE